MEKVAILVDGGFYRRISQKLWGNKSAEERADELFSYCQKHLYNNNSDNDKLYRIFYYDCLPMTKKVYHPLTKKTVDFGKSELYEWSTKFIDALKSKRKVAIRKGTLAEAQACFTLRPDTIKKLCNGTIKIEDLNESHFKLDVKQKGVDMKIGIDIASLSYKKLVSKIILISGDSDFVPAAKLARREGIDFVLDAMHTDIKPELSEHIDGLRSCINISNK